MQKIAATLHLKAERRTAADLNQLWTVASFLIEQKVDTEDFKAAVSALQFVLHGHKEQVKNLRHSIDNVHLELGRAGLPRAYEMVPELGDPDCGLLAVIAVPRMVLLRRKFGGMDKFLVHYCGFRAELFQGKLFQGHSCKSR